PFALLPLADVWPDWKTPWGRTAREEAAHWRWSSNPPFETKRTGYSLTELMGIVNITPDSFSDDGALKHDSIAPVSEIIAAHLNAGCTILDFGAESTRPGGVALTPQEEWARLEPVLKNLQPAPFKFSLDSRHSETVERALEFGLDWINDVTGFASLTMRDAAVRSGKTVVAMHSLTVPVRRDTVLSDDADPLELILRWGFEKIEELEKAGVARERIILDPGIGFGKTPRQNLYLLQNASRFHEWGVGVLVGHSRKSFMAELTGRPPLERDFETAMFSAKLAEAGIEYLRVHDSELNARAISAGGFLE
ncbi:MAG: dihydropteroate synthase, partial [Bdellovibrionia bacterium]